MPAPRRLIMPARIISLWLAISVSAGASFSVEMKVCEAFMGGSRTGVSGAVLAALTGLRVSEGSHTAPSRCNNDFSSEIRGPIMLDREGFRPNVGIVLLNVRNQVFW